MHIHFYLKRQNEIHFPEILHRIILLNYVSNCCVSDYVSKHPRLFIAVIKYSKKRVDGLQGRDVRGEGEKVFREEEVVCKAMLEAKEKWSTGARCKKLRKTDAGPRYVGGGGGPGEACCLGELMGEGDWARWFSSIHLFFMW